jgi:hypothetical protein
MGINETEFERRVNEFCLAIKRRVKNEVALSVNASKDKEISINQKLVNRMKKLKGEIISCR